MFTGIVEAVGTIVDCARRATGVRIGVDAAALDLADVRVGDSIAVAGCCLTVVDLAASGCTSTSRTRRSHARKASP